MWNKRIDIIFIGNFTDLEATNLLIWLNLEYV